MLDVETIQAFAGEALSHQVTQFGVAFTIAAWIHAAQVRKEIKTQFSSITDAINNVSEALKQDLAAQSQRVSKLESKFKNVEESVTVLTGRIDGLEAKGKP